MERCPMCSKPLTLEDIDPANPDTRLCADCRTDEAWEQARRYYEPPEEKGPEEKGEEENE